jgi:hypothetical protein
MPVASKGPSRFDAATTNSTTPYVGESATINEVASTTPHANTTSGSFQLRNMLPDVT